MRAPILLLLLLVLPLLGAGCAAAGAPHPREIRPGEDACEYCHMAVDDPARAAQWVAFGGRALTFDEPGCLLAWLERNPGATGAPFVADEAGSGWIPAEEATFVRGGTETGMGFGIVAYRSADAAGAAAAERGGEVRSWADLLREGVADAHAH